MSVLLYRLGILIARHRGLSIGSWLLALAALIGSSLTLGDNYDDTFTVPGTQSQLGQDLLLDRFDQSGTSAQLIFAVTRGKITDSANAAEVKKLASAVDRVKHVSMSNPLAGSGEVVSPDKGSALGQALFAQKIPSDRTLNEVQRAAVPGPGSAVATYPRGRRWPEPSPPPAAPSCSPAPPLSSR